MAKGFIVPYADAVLLCPNDLGCPAQDLRQIGVNFCQHGYDGVTDWDDATIIAVVAPEERSGINFRMAAAGTISGHVYDQTRTNPIVGLHVYADDFDIQYQISPFRTVVPRPNFISLYLTAFIVEKLINHKSIIDIFGTDEDIYNAVNGLVQKFIYDRL